MPGVSNSAILLILTCSFHFCHPFCVTTDFYDWQGHVTVSCKEPIACGTITDDKTMHFYVSKEYFLVFFILLASTHALLIVSTIAILVRKGHDPFGQHQESRNNLQITCCACWKFGTGQRSRFLVLTKRIAASGVKNEQSRTSSLLSLLRRLDEASDSPKFRYRINFDWFKTQWNGREKNDKESVSHAFESWAYAIQQEVQYFGTLNRDFACFPTASQGERRRWARVCYLEERFFETYLWCSLTSKIYFYLHKQSMSIMYWVTELESEHSIGISSSEFGTQFIRSPSVIVKSIVPFDSFQGFKISSSKPIATFMYHLRWNLKLFSTEIEPTLTSLRNVLC